MTPTSHPGEDRIDLLIRQYHALRMHDWQIAEKLGRSTSMVNFRRRRMELPGVYPLDEDDPEVYLRAAVYRGVCVGHETGRIAEETGATIMQVEMMRRQMPWWWSKHYRRAINPLGDF